MSYPCIDCDDEFETFTGAEEHHTDTGHRIGQYRSHL